MTGSSIRINLLDKSYSLNISRGIISSIGEEIQKIYTGKRIAIITDSNINDLYGKKIYESLCCCGFKVENIVLKPGEKSKSVEVLLQVYDKLLHFGITRGDLIVAFGGGVVGDLAGFAASTFLRGIPFVQVPTSLLAQVDSSVGGKVAVDLKEGKNLIGSFYHPIAVFIDPELLGTLDKRFLHDGMAEVIKYGAIKDEELFKKLLSFKDDKELLENIDEIIYKCCSIKKEVVEKDERDTGERMLLNFGHTIGHAVEKYFDFKEYTHGEAVAVGMYTITKNSEKLGITKKETCSLLKNILQKYCLPFEIKNIDKNKLIEPMTVDKKSSGDAINIILLNKIGEAFIKNIDRESIKNFV